MKDKTNHKTDMTYEDKLKWWEVQDRLSDLDKSFQALEETVSALATKVNDFIDDYDKDKEKSIEDNEEINDILKRLDNFIEKENKAEELKVEQRDIRKLLVRLLNPQLLALFANLKLSATEVDTVKAILDLDQ